MREPSSGDPTDQPPRLDAEPFRFIDVPKRAVRRAWTAAPGHLVHADELHRAGYAGGPFDPKVLLTAATDTALLGMARLIARDVDGERRAEYAAEVQEALALHERAGWRADPAAYHQRPVVPQPTTAHRHQDWEILTFESSYAPPEDEPGSQRWRQRHANNTAVLRVRRVPGDRPWVVMVHGAGMGSLRTDLSILEPERLAALHDVNIAMPVLPLHGERRTPGKFTDTVLPSLDVLDTLHGLAQSIHDVRCCLAWIRSQSSAPVAVYGISLGGFTAASVAALEGPLSGVVLEMPLVDPTSALSSRVGPRQQQAHWFDAYHDANRQLLSVVSPLGLPPPASDPHRLEIYAGRTDRIVPPLAHAVPLQQHWSGPPINWVHGSHTSHLRSKVVRGRIFATLGEHLANPHQHRREGRRSGSRRGSGTS